MKRVLLLALLGLCLMAPVTGGGPGGTPQTDCDDAVNSKVLYDTATGLWSCGVDQGGGATWGFGTITTGASSAVADVGGDTLNVNDGNTIDFTASNGPPDSLTAEVHFANSPRLMGRTTAGAGDGEEITVASPLTLAATTLDVTNIATADLADGADIMFASAYDTFGTGYSVDIASSANGFDYDNDGTWEALSSPASNKIEFNPNDDATVDFSMTTTSGTGITSNTQPIGTAKEFALGDGSAATQGVSSCIARDTTTNADRLFEDKDCDVMVGSTTTPEAGEGMLTNIIAKSTSDHTLASTTGTEVTGLRIQLDVAGTYDVRYTILSQSSSSGVGLAYGVNYSGTTASIQCKRRYAANAASTIASVAAGAAGPLTEEVWITDTMSTTAPNMGPNTGGVQNTNTTALENVHCLVVVTTPGATAATRRLEFWHSSETATNTSVMTNSTVSAERIN